MLDIDFGTFVFTCTLWFPARLVATLDFDPHTLQSPYITTERIADSSECIRILEHIVTN